MTRFPLMERSATLFPDLLDAWANTAYETHVFSGPSTYRYVGGTSDHRAIVVLWNDPKRDVEPGPRWTVEIRHYLNSWSGEGRKRQHHFRTRAVRRHFPDRTSVLKFIEKINALFERGNAEREAVSA